jgi:hypothetical protein
VADDVIMVHWNVIFIRQIGNQLSRPQIFCCVIPEKASCIKACMLDADRMLIVPEVAYVEGDIFFVEQLIHCPIGIDDVVDAHTTIHILESIDAIQRSPFYIVNSYKIDRQITGTIRTYIGARRIIRHKIAVKRSRIDDAVDSSRIIRLVILHASLRQGRGSFDVGGRCHIRLDLLRREGDHFPAIGCSAEATIDEFVDFIGIQIGNVLCGGMAIGGNSSIPIGKRGGQRMTRFT